MNEASFHHTFWRNSRSSTITNEHSKSKAHRLFFFLQGLSHVCLRKTCVTPECCLLISKSLPGNKFCPYWGRGGVESCSSQSSCCSQFRLASRKKYSMIGSLQERHSKNQHLCCELFKPNPELFIFCFGICMSAKTSFHLCSQCSDLHLIRFIPRKQYFHACVYLTNMTAVQQYILLCWVS